MRREKQRRAAACGREAALKRHIGRQRLICSVIALLMGALVVVLGGCSDRVLVDGAVSVIGENTLGVPDAGSQGVGGILTVPEGTTPSAPVVTLPRDEIEPEPYDPADYPDAYADSEHRMYVEFLDTGKSDCILIRMDDKVILVDTGESEGDVEDYGRIKGRLEGYGITVIDCLIITHYDNDHIGSAHRVLRDYTVRTVYMPDYVRHSSRYRAMMEMLEAVEDRTVLKRLQGEEITVPMGYGSLVIHASALYERGQVASSSGDPEREADENDYSLITSVYFGETSLLLLGDAERARMEEFKEGRTETYDLVKTPHHGGTDQGLRQFLYAATPSWCVVCTDDVSQIQAQLATDMTNLCGADGWYVTSRGTVRLSTNGTDITVEQYTK